MFAAVESATCFTDITFHGTKRNQAMNVGANFLSTLPAGMTKITCYTSILPSFAIIVF